jgi:hypothetical protein
MNPEHKNLAMQTETLNRLRDDIWMMSSGIMLEEAALGDFKRTTRGMWMGLKFGGLLECCEKARSANFRLLSPFPYLFHSAYIAGEYGKFTISVRNSVVLRAQILNCQIGNIGRNHSAWLATKFQLWR